MYEIKRFNGRTKIIMPGMTMVSDRINRDRYNELRKEAKIIRDHMETFQGLLTRALAQGKRK